MLNEHDLADYKAMGWNQPQYNPVDKPKHYMLLPGIEVRDVIQALAWKIPKQNHPLFVSDYVQMMQYLMRFMSKNGKEDLEKARWYLDKLIDSIDTQ